jgi:nucleoside-diphosphate-sugar epimerase
MNESASLKNRKVVLIGGAGFIGHNMALQLKRRGVDVQVIDGLQVNNLVTFSASAEVQTNRDLYLKFIRERLDLLYAAGIPLHTQDARDYHGMSKILAQIKPQVIVHLAAVSHAGRSNKDPYSTFDHSLRTLENALDYARGNIEHFIFFSSSMVYGNFMTKEVDEEHPLNPMGIYGALKVAGEKIVVAYQQVFNLPYTIIRPSALYGERCVSRRVGQIFVENALAGKPLKMEGDGKESLDFTYIDDLVEGVCLAIEKPEARNQVFNMTYGQSRTINELAEVIRKEFPGIVIEHIERDQLMPFRGTLSVQKARRMLGYAPKNPVEVGFPKYISWYRSLK